MIIRSDLLYPWRCGTTLAFNIVDSSTIAQFIKNSKASYEYVYIYMILKYRNVSHRMRCENVFTLAILEIWTIA